MLVWVGVAAEGRKVHQVESTGFGYGYDQQGIGEHKNEPQVSSQSPLKT